MNEDLLEILGDRLTDRIQKANTYYLTKIGEMIKRIRDLKPTQAQQLVQMLKYGGSYEEILIEISSLTGIDPIEIDRMFAQYSRNDLNFAKKFYDYRNIPFIPFDENIALKRQTEALANITKNAMNNFTRSRALGYSFKELDGTTKFYGLRETYEKVLDEALINVGQGRDTFDNSMTRILKELGGSGLRTLDYESGRSIRLDSMVRMHLKSGLRELHNENQRLLGEEYGADMVEVSHHSNSALDHIDTVDGKQFALIDKIKEQIKSGIEKEIKMEDIEENRVKVKGKWYYDYNYINDNLERPVSTLNCYHYTFSGILGISKPRYTKRELQEDKEKNMTGCEIDGKHYTLYEASQLQREFERRIREQKDIQILGKSSNNDEVINEAQSKITILTRKYKEICDISGLPYKAKRLSVVGYKRAKLNK